jgi:sugar lactone lactonase YvrE
VDGSGAAARFNNPEGIAVDARGNLYVADTGNRAVRKITPTGVVSTVVGRPARLNWPRALCPARCARRGRWPSARKDC